MLGDLKSPADVAPAPIGYEQAVQDLDRHVGSGHRGHNVLSKPAMSYLRQLTEGIDPERPSTREADWISYDRKKTELFPFNNFVVEQVDASNHPDPEIKALFSDDDVVGEDGEGISCEICANWFFDDEMHAPWCSSCGHSFCKRCVDQLGPAAACTKCRCSNISFVKNFAHLELLATYRRKLEIRKVKHSGVPNHVSCLFVEQCPHHEEGCPETTEMELITVKSDHEYHEQVEVAECGDWWHTSFDSPNEIADVGTFVSRKKGHWIQEHLLCCQNAVSNVSFVEGLVMVSKAILKVRLVLWIEN